MLELKNINKTYQIKKNKVEALKNINLKFNDTGFNFILGKTGCGKSTLLNIIGTLDNPTSGSIYINNIKLKLKEEENYRNDYVGFMFQEFNLLEDLNVYENITLPIRLQNKKIENTEIDEVLEKLEIKDLKNRKVFELSGGQKARIALARVLIKKPKILLCDEPTGNLDNKTGNIVMDLLKEISKETLVIMVTHNEEYANTYADRVIKIKDGEIIEDNYIEEASIEKGHKFNKAILPMKETLKIAIRSLKTMKFKTVLIIILLSFSFMFLGLISTIKNYNVKEHYIKALQTNDYDDIKLYKKFETVVINNLSSKELNYLKENGLDLSLKYELYDSHSFANIFKLNKYVSTNMFDGTKDDEHSLYSKYGIDITFVELTETNKTTNEIIGKLPSKNGEIMLSSYLADMIIETGIKEYGTENIYYPKTYEEIVNSNKLFYFGNYNSCNIVGIIKYDTSKFNILKEYKYEQGLEVPGDIHALWMELSSKQELYSNVYVYKEFLNSLNHPFVGIGNDDYSVTIDSELIKDNNSVNNIESDIEYYNGTSWVHTSELKENEILINLNAIIENYYDFQDYAGKELLLNPNEGQDEAEKKALISYIDCDKYIGKTVPIKVIDNYNNKVVETKDYKIVGIIRLTDNSISSSLVDKEYFKKYETKYAQIKYITLNNITKSNVEELVDKMSNFEDYKIYNDVIRDVDSIYATINDSLPVIKIFNIIFLSLAILMIIYFSITFISRRKKEIGILKSMGVSIRSISKIFFIQNLIIILISFINSIILLQYIFVVYTPKHYPCSFNNVVTFTLNIKILLINLLLAVVVFIISNIIPLLKISHMSSTETIK